MAEHGATLQALARTISGLRAERGFTQEELAERAKMSANHLSKIENADTNPGFAAIVSLAEALDMTTGDLVARYEELAARAQGRRGS